MIKIASLAVGALLLAAPAAHAAPRVFVGVGVAGPVPLVAPVRVAPVVVAPPIAVVRPAPGYGYVWRPAYWMPGPRFVSGAWVRPPFPRAVWVAPRYVARPHGRVWVAGYWR